MADPDYVPFLPTTYDARLLQTSREAIQQSLDLLESTRPLVKQPDGQSGSSDGGLHQHEQPHDQNPEPEPD